MCNQKITNYDLVPSKKMDKVLEGLGKEPKSIWVRDVLTINEKGEVKLFGFTIRKGKK